MPAHFSALFLLTTATLALAAPEAFEISPERLGDLPGGKEADGITGDLVMRNDTVELVISGNLPERRANMSTFYGADGITPGCLYDLCLRGSKNDQITIFSPAGQRGAISWVRIVKDGRDGEAEIETVTTAASNKGLYRRHVWRLRDGMSGVEVETLLRNESPALLKLPLEDKLTGLPASGQAGENGVYYWGDATDPADKAGYAVQPLRGPVELAPGEEKRVTRFLAVATSPAAAVGLLVERAGQAGRALLHLRDRQGKPVHDAKVTVVTGGREVPGYPDAQGEAAFGLPAGSHQLRVSANGRAPQKFTLEVLAGNTAEREIILPDASGIVFDITEEGSGKPLPCKVNFTPLEGAPAVDLGPPGRAHGCVDQWHAESGKFSVNLAPGRYRVIVTRGPEYAHLAKEVEVTAAQQTTLTGALKRLVVTRGWVSTDFHNHSTPSGDNTCRTEDRIINLVAEHIEFAPTTEHNRLYDWEPYIKKLGLSEWISTVSGVELTGPNQHLNAFPFQPRPGLQDNGAPLWNNDPRIAAITLRHWQLPDPDRWVQINHPNLERVFTDRDADGKRDTGYENLALFVDAWEIENFIDPGILESSPFRIQENGPGQPRKVRYNREFIYLQLLNQGHRLKATAVSDAHSVHGNGTGGWRVWLPSATDDPAKVDWREMARAARAGRGILSTGPFMEVTANGAPPGTELQSGGKPVTLKVKVQCTDWLDIDRVQVLVNGRQPAELNFTRQSHPDWFGSGVVKFEREIPVPLTKDAHLIVVAVDADGDLKTCFGTSLQSPLKPQAWHNPFYIDADGSGWTPNGDTLGYDIPVTGMTVEEVQRILSLAH